MIRRILKSEVSNVNGVPQFLFLETGGAVFLAGQVTDGGDCWVCPVQSVDGGSVHRGAAQGRQLFRVIGDGVASDDTKYKGKPVEFYFDAKLGLKPGTIFSADIPGETHINSASIFVESIVDQQGNDVRVSYERKEFESVGLGRGGWTPPEGAKPDTGLSGGTPDSGRLSHPRDTVVTEPTREELLARIAELERRLAEKK